jgi:hypothetical protein
MEKTPPEFWVRRFVISAERLTCAVVARVTGTFIDDEVWEFVNAHAGHRLRFEERTEKVCSAQTIS